MTSKPHLYKTSGFKHFLLTQVLGENTNHLAINGECLVWYLEPVRYFKCIVK